MKFGDPCTNFCAHADAVGADYYGSCTGGYCDHYNTIKNVTAIVVVEHHDGSTETLHLSLENAENPTVEMKNQEQPDPFNSWSSLKMMSSAPIHVDLRVQGTVQSNKPYATITKMNADGSPNVG